MTYLLRLSAVLAIFALLSCNRAEEKKTEPLKFGRKEAPESVEKVPDESIPPSELVDLTNKGIGPVKSLNLEAIDESMVEEGRVIYRRMCMACHRIDKKFIGPAAKGILDRRTPEWVMNMILNPEEMVQEDPLAKALLREYNGSPMVNQNLSMEEARAVLEYMRSL